MLYKLIKWDSFKDIVKQSFGINFVKVDDFFKSDIVWNKFEGWEDATDIDIISALSILKPFVGELLIVTDASYKSNLSPFCVKAEVLMEFANKHSENFGEQFYDTDVLIINPKKRLVWIFHHEGVYGVIDLTKNV